MFLAWPALFLSLGWNFLEYGFFAVEGDWVWSWLFCGVLFVLMGAVPLAIGLGIAREGSGGSGRAYASGRVVVRPRPPREVPPCSGRASAEAAAVRPTMTKPSSTASSAWRRCAGGVPHLDEFDTAKAATLAEAAAAHERVPAALASLRRFLAAIVGVVGAVWLFGFLASSGG